MAAPLDDSLDLLVQTMKQQMLNQASPGTNLGLRKAISSVENRRDPRLRFSDPNNPACRSVPANLKYKSPGDNPSSLVAILPLPQPQGQKKPELGETIQQLLRNSYTFLSLPDKILLIIIDKLDTCDKIRLSQVCSIFRLLIRSNYQHLLLQRLLPSCPRCCVKSELQRRLCSCRTFEIRAATIAELSSSPESDSNMQLLLEALRADTDNTIRSLCLTALASKYIGNEQAQLAIQKVAESDPCQRCRSQATLCLLYRDDSSKSPPQEKCTGLRLSNSFSGKPRKKGREGVGRVRSNSTDGDSSPAKVTVHRTATECVVMRIDTPLQDRKAS